MPKTTYDKKTGTKTVLDKNGKTVYNYKENTITTYNKKGKTIVDNNPKSKNYGTTKVNKNCVSSRLVFWVSISKVISLLLGWSIIA